jgi:hypothetical protein
MPIRRRHGQMRLLGRSTRSRLWAIPSELPPKVAATTKLVDSFKIAPSCRLRREFDDPTRCH